MTTLIHQINQNFTNGNISNKTNLYLLRLKTFILVTWSVCSEHIGPLQATSKLQNSPDFVQLWTFQFYLILKVKSQQTESRLNGNNNNPLMT